MEEVIRIIPGKEESQLIKGIHFDTGIPCATIVKTIIRNSLGLESPETTSRVVKKATEKLKSRKKK